METRWNQKTELSAIELQKGYVENQLYDNLDAIARFFRDLLREQKIIATLKKTGSEKITLGLDDQEIKVLDNFVRMIEHLQTHLDQKEIEYHLHFFIDIQRFSFVNEEFKSLLNKTYHLLAKNGHLFATASKAEIDFPKEDEFVDAVEIQAQLESFYKKRKREMDELQEDFTFFSISKDKEDTLADSLNRIKFSPKEDEKEDKKKDNEQSKRRKF
ncbi:hypothetical protein [Aquicella lusitana]|uniref:Uncharacterized protein n=1 Tax=Aquicella lusitana TaxID=254246 RepID=A0A370H478_9COXI|nr:hypothetical protein [Aquicella lusitana]RDI48854.1 hypothetical protein C8D86_101137 [Aquicella lusitana]VVC73282.1 hypothetical protein AQULUS_10170 [Aquicella lusitana]